MSHPISENKKFLGPFMLAMITVSAIISLRNLPITALHGSQAVFFYLTAGIIFLIPIALCCAELASGWPEQGGIYNWVKQAFGASWGVLTIWLEWIGSVIWLPGILGFLATTTAYLINPALSSNKLFLISVMLTYLWGATFLNFKGIKTSSLVSTFGVIIGSLLPAAILLLLGLPEIPEAIANSSAQLDFSNYHWIPSQDLATLSTFTGLLLGFAGMEIPAYYVKSVAHPKKDYPRAMFLAAGIILVVSILGSLAISASVPKESISFLGGTMQAFYVFFNKFNLAWATPALACLILIGGFALLNTWIIGPSRGLLSCAQAGDIPKLFRKTNSQDVPVTLLLLQAGIGSLIISAYIFIPSMNAAFWIMNTLAAQTYLIMYSLVFLACLKLRYSQPNIKRAYKIPGGTVGIWGVSGLGLIGCFLAILVGFLKPEEINLQINHSTYFMILLNSILICVLPPFLYKNLKKT